ncbi:MAG: hypothetical protein ACR2QE_18170 [Acidimicrobiales bacterium]
MSEPRDDGAEADETAAPDLPVRDEDVVDELPADLNVSEFVGPYLFPNNSRRRVPGVIYLVMAAGCVALWVATGDADRVLVNDGFLWAGIGLALVGLYHLQAGWNLAVDERDALVAATREAGFPVGHASAQLGWRGLRSRPTWRILLYSHESPPSQRGLVLVDGVDGEVIDRFFEANPEDWTGLE